MYKYIPDFEDENNGAFRELGISGIVGHAQKFCQPQWHGFPVWAETADMYELSQFVRGIEDRFNADLKRDLQDSDEEFTETRGNSMRFLAGLEDSDFAQLPAAYADCTPAENSSISDQQIVVMLFAAQALDSADTAADLIIKNDCRSAIKVLNSAALSLAKAAEFSGFQEAARAARKIELAAAMRRSASGGLARAEKYAPIKKWVLEQYVSRAWVSKMQAARTLHTEALELSLKIGQPLSADRAMATVYDWIRNFNFED